jgi:MFS family permease
MNASKAEDEGREQLAATDAELDSAPAVGPSRAATRTTLIVSIILAVAGAWISANLADRFLVLENVEHGTKYRGTQLVIGNATQNSAVAYALVGATLSLILGVTAGCLLGRFSIRRVLTAGIAGIVLGASFGAASSYGLTPLYFNRMETADVTFTMLIHLGIWTAVGAASGITFGIGAGNRNVFLASFIGGITGAALATLLFDVCGVFFPFAHTERPLSQEAGTRLAANIVLCLCVVIGIVVVASQKTRVKPNTA